MELEIHFPGCDSPRKLFDRPIIDPQAFPGSLGRGLNWKNSVLFGPPGKSICWVGCFSDASIVNQDILPCEPSTLVLSRRNWSSSLGQISLAEFVFAAEWVLGLEKIDGCNVPFYSMAREIGFSVSIFSPLDGGNINVIIELQDLYREGGHYLPWQMGSNMDCQWVVYRKKETVI